MTILHMDISTVRSACQQMRNNLDTMRQSLEAANRSASEVDWSGQGRDQFVQDYLAATSWAFKLLQSGEELILRVEIEISEWEQLDNLTGGSEKGEIDDVVLPDDFRQSSFWENNIGDLMVGGLRWTKFMRDAAERFIVPAIVLSSIHAGADGLIHLTGKKFVKEFFMGLPKNYTRSHASTLVKKITKVNVAVEAAFLAFDWVTDYQENKDKGWEAVAKAMVGSAGEAGGGIVVGVAGAYVGAALGTALIPIPGVGTVVGGLVGNAIGSWVGEQVAGKATDGLMNNEELWKKTTVDENVHQVLDKAITGAQNWVLDF